MTSKYFYSIRPLKWTAFKVLVHKYPDGETVEEVHHSAVGDGVVFYIAPRGASYQMSVRLQSDHPSQYLRKASVMDYMMVDVGSAMEKAQSIHESMIHSRWLNIESTPDAVMNMELMRVVRLSHEFRPLYDRLKQGLDLLIQHPGLHTIDKISEYLREAREEARKWERHRLKKIGENNEPL